VTCHGRSCRAREQGALRRRRCDAAGGLGRHRCLAVGGMRRRRYFGLVRCFHAISLYRKSKSFFNRRGTDGVTCHGRSCHAREHGARRRRRCDAAGGLGRRRCLGADALGRRQCSAVERRRGKARGRQNPRSKERRELRVPGSKVCAEVSECSVGCRRRLGIVVGHDLGASVRSLLERGRATSGRARKPRGISTRTGAKSTSELVAGAYAAAVR
jgi:hypothetical protein